MSQIEGTPEVIEPGVEPGVVAPAEPEEIEYSSPEEQLFAEEVDRRERGEDEPAPAPVVEPVLAEPGVVVAPEPGTPDSGVVAQPDGAATPAPPQPEVERPAWYDGLSEEAKLAFDQQQDDMSRLQLQYSAVYGRLAPMQAENDRMKRLAPGQPQPQPVAGGQPTPTAPTPAPDFETKEFKEFAENYPDEAKVIMATAVAQHQHSQRLETRLNNLAAGLDQVQNFSTTQQMQHELSALEERHPDWMIIRNSPEFDSWMQTQPPAVQPMVNSKQADECSWLLDRYKQDVYLYQLQQTGGTPVEPNPQQVRANQTVAHRATLISTPTPDPQGGGVGVPGGLRPPQTAEDMWVEELERRVNAQKSMRS